MKTKQKEEQANTPEKTVQVEYNNAYLLKGKALQPFTTDYETAAKISQEKQSLEKKFKNENEISELVLNNGKILFGENTVIVDMHKQSAVEFALGFYPDGVLFVAGEKPKVYLVEVILSKENFASLFMQLTGFFSFFKNKENIELFRKTIGIAISKNIGLRNKMKKFLGDRDVYDFLDEAIKEKPAVLLIMDSFKQELTGIMETYTETWGKFVKPIMLRKFALNGDTIITIVPAFSELSKKMNGKKNGSADKVIKATEEDHTESVSETVKEIFLEIKSELQKVNIDVEFRVKQHYISLRKDRNLAFFQLGKKKLSIVIANPEKNMQKQIKHHEIRQLAESVKKFWNGNEHCFTVVVENKEYLEEITSLLKKLIAGNESMSDETAPETPEIAPEAIKKAKKGKTTSQAKPKRKNRK